MERVRFLLEVQSDFSSNTDIESDNEPTDHIALCTPSTTAEYDEEQCAIQIINVRNSTDGCYQQCKNQIQATISKENGEKKTKMLSTQNSQLKRKITSTWHHLLVLFHYFLTIICSLKFFMKPI